MSRKSLLLIAFAGSAGSLIGAFFFQYVMAILPCHLCLLQRWPHATLALLALFALAIRLPHIAWIGALLAAVSASLAVYHSGVERKFWAGPSDCTGGQNLGALSGSDLISTDIASPIIRCDEISWSILGLSFANLNLLLSLVLIVIWVKAARAT